jgi:hypothetical protein
MRRLLFTLGLLGLLCQQTALWIFASPLQQDCSGVVITSPRSSGDPVRGRVSITGSATIANFQFYKIEVAAGDNPPDSAFRVIGNTHNNSVVNGQLEVWDTTSVPDGRYALKLTVVDIRGNFPCPPFVVRSVIIGNRAPTATPTSTPTVTPTPTAVATATRPAAPTVPVPTSVVRATPTPEPTRSASPLIEFNPQPYVQALIWGGCAMGSLIGLIVLFVILRWIRDQL